MAVRAAGNFYTQVDRMAAHKMNFFSAMTTSSIPFDIPKYGQWELEMQAYCADRHMTYVPSLNLGQTLSEVDSRTGEGIWARDVPCIVGLGGEILPDSPAFLPLRNGGFEEGPPTATPLGWRVVGGGAVCWMQPPGCPGTDGLHLATSKQRTDIDEPVGLVLLYLRRGQRCPGHCRHLVRSQSPLPPARRRIRRRPRVREY